MVENKAGGYELRPGHAHDHPAPRSVSNICTGSFGRGTWDASALPCWTPYPPPTSLPFKPLVQKPRIRRCSKLRAFAAIFHCETIIHARTFQRRKHGLDEVSADRRPRVLYHQHGERIRLRMYQALRLCMLIISLSRKGKV